ncbi:CsbD family protein [Rhodocyclus tenuis]|uniref:CsbD family protein n=1 Tax=Rhodocyclus gracilis TaxID=2929842 RepID=UPI001298C564|nr:CsbD family protein [Rhodocyclus gracilis]MRD71659.1 CsbD family protein [Rhodocyclus gracilis]
MNWDIVAGNWKQFRGKVRARWGKLTDDHLDVIAGKRTELSGKLQESYGITREEAEEQIKGFEVRNKDLFPPHTP